MFTTLFPCWNAAAEQRVRASSGRVGSKVDGTKRMSETTSEEPAKKERARPRLRLLVFVLFNSFVDLKLPNRCLVVTDNGSASRDKEMNQWAICLR